MSRRIVYKYGVLDQAEEVRPGHCNEKVPALYLALLAYRLGFLSLSSEHLLRVLGSNALVLVNAGGPFVHSRS